MEMNGHGVELTKEERQLLLKLAREAVKADLRGDRRPPLPEPLAQSLKAHLGAFVSLHQGDRLRGCIGSFLADQPLGRTVQEMAVSAATRDPRFASVTSSELPGLTFEISVLSPLQEIQGGDKTGGTGPDNDDSHAFFLISYRMMVFITLASGVVRYSSSWGPVIS